MTADLLLVHHTVFSVHLFGVEQQVGLGASKTFQMELICKCQPVLMVTQIELGKHQLHCNWSCYERLI